MVPPGAGGILAASIILPILTIVAVSLRVVARRKRKAPLQSDDWTIIVNLVITHSDYTKSFMLIIVSKIFVVGISVGAIYACCTGIHGVPFNLMDPETWGRYRKVSR